MEVERQGARMIMDELAEHEVVYSAIKSSEKQTNSDKIRSMSDEELADWIVKHDNKTNENGYWTREMILEYMKSEVAHGN
jgi:VIT1/CCC1 family predicted Fe2+/Mn2+ transporter